MILQLILSILGVVAPVVTIILMVVTAKHHQRVREGLEIKVASLKQSRDEASKAYSSLKKNALLITHGLSIDKIQKRITLNNEALTPLGLHKLLCDLLDGWELESRSGLLDISDPMITLRETDDRIRVSNHWAIVWNDRKFISGELLVDMSNIKENGAIEQTKEAVSAIKRQD